MTVQAESIVGTALLKDNMQAMLTQIKEEQEKLDED